MVIVGSLRSPRLWIAGAAAAILVAACGGSGVSTDSSGNAGTSPGSAQNAAAGPTGSAVVAPPATVQAPGTPPAPPAAQGATNSTTLSWEAPTVNTDGSALTNLGGYKIYYGTASGDYTNSISVATIGLSTYVINGLTVGQRYFFAVTAVSTDGVEGPYSEELVDTIG
jgi:hypothetical protein